MNSNIQQKFKIFLQPFSEQVSDDSWFEFNCCHCKETVKTAPRIQRDLAVGGVGHKCNGCGTYYALIGCPNCQNTVIFDDKEWDLLAETSGVNCPNCNVVLFRDKEICTPVLGGYVESQPSLVSWSLSLPENEYIAKIRKKYSEQHQLKIAIRHHSVGTRMRAAREALDYLEYNKWYCQMVISNTPNPIKQETYKTPFDYDFHNNLFSFINNLRSALDMLSQEIALIALSNGYKESKIEFMKIDTLLDKNYSDLKDHVSQFQKNTVFNYLNKLRNVLQHRRIPILVNIGEFETKELDSIRPINIKSLAVIHLPDDPYKEPEQFQFSSNIELFSFIKKAYDEIYEFILDAYLKSNP